MGIRTSMAFKLVDLVDTKLSIMAMTVGGIRATILAMAIVEVVGMVMTQVMVIQGEEPMGTVIAMAMTLAMTLGMAMTAIVMAMGHLMEVMERWTVLGFQ